MDHITVVLKFPISRDPPEGGTIIRVERLYSNILLCFQFLGIPPKGEHKGGVCHERYEVRVSNF